MVSQLAKDLARLLAPSAFVICGAVLSTGPYWKPACSAERPIPMNAVNRWKVLSQVHSALVRGEPRHNTAAIRKRTTARSGESAP